MNRLHLVSFFGLVGCVAGASQLAGCNVEVCESGAQCEDHQFEDGGSCTGDDDGDDGDDGSQSSGGAAQQGGSNAGGNNAGGNNAGGAAEGGGSGGEGGAPVACVKSCECPEGEVCANWTCQPRTPAPISCLVDCDCPSGSLCDAGFCVAP